MIPLNCVKYARLKFLSDSYKDTIKNSVLKRENTGNRNPVFWHILCSAMEKYSTQKLILKKLLL